MKRRSSPILVYTLLAGLVWSAAVPSAASAEQRFIARPATGVVGLLGAVLDGLGVMKLACAIVGCTPQYALDNDGKVFLATTNDNRDPNLVVSLLKSLTLIQDAEIDQIVKTQGGSGNSVPPALLDKEPVNYYGVTVRGGYVRQPANRILGIDTAHNQYGLTGYGVTVAVIDTGVDPSHPVLKPVLLAGYDFTRNQSGASERGDVTQSTVGAVDSAQPGWVNQSTVACLDQSTVAALDDRGREAFGHGTMVSGVVHLVAPKAKILPLKAFRVDGSGYASDVLRAIYYASKNGAKVMNMSFNFSTSSPELKRAIDYAASRGTIAISSTGNNGQRVDVYPASLPNVMGVASTTDYDTLSTFSNYGPDVAWLAAPGEAIVTTYPYGSWAAAWGTSFSTPFAAGAAALLVQDSSNKINNDQTASAEGQAVWFSAEVKRGRLDIPKAIRAWRTSVGGLIFLP